MIDHTDENPVEPLWNNEWQPPDDSFHSLPLQKKQLAVPITQAYLVFDSSSKSHFVRAESVIEAIRASGIASPSRVQRVGTDHYNVYYSNGLTIRNQNYTASE